MRLNFKISCNNLDQHRKPTAVPIIDTPAFCVYAKGQTPERNQEKIN